MKIEPKLSIKSYFALIVSNKYYEELISLTVSAGKSISRLFVAYFYWYIKTNERTDAFSEAFRKKDKEPLGLI